MDSNSNSFNYSSKTSHVVIPIQTISHDCFSKSPPQHCSVWSVNEIKRHHFGERIEKNVIGSGREKACEDNFDAKEDGPLPQKESRSNTTDSAREGREEDIVI